ncbi:MAG: hypothetical protein F6K24_02850 [Okeania sp. SIO2D1]|nr:hypothetical protein [Okeania sp. SIO2D1]
MAIEGLRDKVPVVYRFFLGTPKVPKEKNDPNTGRSRVFESYGRDLKEWFRLDCDIPMVIKCLKTFLPEDEWKEETFEIAESNGRGYFAIATKKFLLVKKVPIYLCGQSLRSNFDPYMEKRSKNGKELDRRCTKSRIIKERDRAGNLNVCDRPCEWDEDHDKCPFGCCPSGVLKFYLQSAYHSGLSSCVGQISLHSWTQIAGIETGLKNIEEKFGTLRTMKDFICPQTEGQIPYNLVRVPQVQMKPRFDNGNGKKIGTMEGEVWSIAIEPDPRWVQGYLEDKQRRYNRFISLPISNYPRHIEGQHQQEFLPASIPDEGELRKIEFDNSYSGDVLSELEIKRAIANIYSKYLQSFTKEQKKEIIFQAGGKIANFAITGVKVFNTQSKINALENQVAMMVGRIPQVEPEIVF